MISKSLSLAPIALMKSVYTDVILLVTLMPIKKRVHEEAGELSRSDAPTEHLRATITKDCKHGGVAGKLHAPFEPCIRDANFPRLDIGAMDVAAVAVRFLPLGRELSHGADVGDGLFCDYRRLVPKSPAQPFAVLE